jgi:hypothetical protein
MFRLEQHWQRSDVTIRERCYQPEQVQSALTQAGFREIEAHDARQLGMWGDLGVGRIWFVART